MTDADKTLGCLPTPKLHLRGCGDGSVGLLQLPEGMRWYVVNGIDHFEPRLVKQHWYHVAEFVPEWDDPPAAGQNWYAAILDRFEPARIESELVSTRRIICRETGGGIYAKKLPSIYRCYVAKSDQHRAKGLING